MARVAKSYRLEQTTLDRLDAIAQREGLTATAALEKAVLTYEDGIKAQDAQQREIELLRAKVDSLREQLDESREFASTMAELFKREQANVSAITETIQATQMVTGMTLAKTAPTTPTVTTEVVPQPQAPRMTFRQWLAQRWAR